MITLVGVQRRDYVSQKSGKPVKGYNVWFGETREGVIGMSTKDGFVSDSEMDRICGRIKCKFDEFVGMEAKPYYNQYGRIDSFDIL